MGWTSPRQAEAERQLDLFYGNTEHSCLSCTSSFFCLADELTDKKAQKQAHNREREELLRNEQVAPEAAPQTKKTGYPRAGTAARLWRILSSAFCR